VENGEAFVKNVCGTTGSVRISGSGSLALLYRSASETLFKNSTYWTNRKNYQCKRNVKDDRNQTITRSTAVAVKPRSRANSVNEKRLEAEQ
jgi:hypothetical protein